MSDLSTSAVQAIQYDECAIVIPQATSYSGYLSIKDSAGQELVLISTESISITVTDSNGTNLITKNLTSSNYSAAYHGYYLSLTSSNTNVAKGRHSLKVTYTDINNVVYPVNVARYCLII